MAIQLSSITILIRKSEIDEKYPGGLDRFRSDWMIVPTAFCEDDHLAAFSFRGHYYFGIEESCKEFDIAVAVGSEAAGFGEECDWLEKGVTVDEQDPTSGESPICWLKGTDPGEIVRFGPKIEKRKRWQFWRS